MKVFALILATSLANGLNLSQKKDNVPEGVCAEEWNKYRESKGEHDCEIKEPNNWFGTARCFASWECQGARTCLSGTLGDKIGWCNGDSACENLGPLDYHDEVSKLFKVFKFIEYRMEILFGIMAFRAQETCLNWKLCLSEATFTKYRSYLRKNIG